MAIQVLREKPTIGERFGTGLGQGLELLAQQKLAQFAKRQQRTQTQQALEGLGLPAQTAAGIGALPQNLQVEYIKNMRKQQQQQALQQALGGFTGGEGLATSVGATGSQVGGAAEGVAAPAVASGKQGGVVDAFGGADIPAQQQLQLAQMRQKEALAREKMEQRERFQAQKLSAKEQEQIDKETFKASESFSTAGEDARNKVPLVEEFIRISLEGDPGSPASNTMREVLGNFAFGKDVPRDWIYTDDAAIQKKLSAQLVKLTLEKMQGRKSVEVLKAIRRTFPNIYQNRDAQLAIAKTLLYEYKMNDLKDRLQDRIKEENGGRRPRNFKSLVEKLARRLEPAISRKYLPKLGAYKARKGEVV